MTRAQLWQVGALFLVPTTSFVVIRALSGDVYLPVSVSYLLFLVIARFVELEPFVALPAVRSLRDSQNDVPRTFVFAPAKHSPPTIETTAGVILQDQNIRAAARFEYLLSETARAVASAREEMIKIMFINVFLIVFLVIITSAQGAAATTAKSPPSPSTTASQGPTEGGGAPVVSGGTAAASAPAVSDAFSAQVRLAMSYVAVVLQLLWLGQPLFHYRQKNVEVVAQASATARAEPVRDAGTAALALGQPNGVSETRQGP